MKKLSKKDRIIVTIASIVLTIALSCQGWYYWPWFGGEVYRTNLRLTDFSSYQTTKTSFSSDDLFVENTTGLDKHQLCKLFRCIVINIEFGLPTRAIQKWEDPLRLFIDGTPSDEDLAIIEEICDTMNSTPGFPGISTVPSEEEANFVFHLLDDAEYDHWERTHLVKHSNGLTTFIFNDDRTLILSVDGGVRNSLDRYNKTSVIWEEMMQATGLKNDTIMYSETLFYNGAYNVSKATPFDILMLRLLYLPQIKPGMPYAHCLPYLFTFIR